MTRLAIVHPTELVGQQLRELLDERSAAWESIELLTTREEEGGVLTEARGRAAMVRCLTDGGMADVDLAFFCGAMADNQRPLETLPPAARAVLLASDAGLADGRPMVAGVNLREAPTERVLVSPHPAVVALARLVAPLADFGLQSAVASVVQPVSVFGATALDDLLAQARDVLSFQPITASASFDRQIAFDLQPAALATGTLVEQLASVLGDGVGVSLQLLQAGVFHGLSLSVHLDFTGEVSAERVGEAIGGAPSVRLAGADESVSPVGIAGENGIAAAVTDDPRGGVWLWAVADNLRLAAGNALSIAEAIW